MKIICIGSLTLFAAFVFFACAPVHKSFSPEPKLTAADARADFTLLRSILEQNHPSLYWYTTTDSLNNYFNQVQSTFNDSVTELQFKNKVAWFINKIHCGHTAVRSSKRFVRSGAQRRHPQFPLSLKVWDDTLVMINSNIRYHPELTRGTIITSINGYTNRKLLDSIFSFISTDGYIRNFKQQLVSFNFPYYFHNAFGIDSSYQLSYIDTNGRAGTTTVKNLYPRPIVTKREMDSLRGISSKDFRQFRRMSKRSLLIDTALSTAILKINTFSEVHLQSFFRRSFRNIKREGVKNLVIDLRENGGGDIMSSTRLTQYIIDHPFRIADTVAGISRSFKHKRYIKPWFIYWLSMHVTGRKRDDGRIHFRFFEQHAFKPKSHNHFSGNTYLLAGGYSFSASTLFIGALKGQQNVTVVGEETGGGSYGNTAMHLPVITLPKSKVRVTLPLYRIVIDQNRPKTGRGIFPDIEVKPGSPAIKRGLDAKMEKVHQLITTGYKHVQSK